jgi:hypothetical protein
MNSMAGTLEPGLEDAAQRYAAGRERVDSIVDDTGFNRGRISRAAAKLGLDTTDRKRVIAGLRERIDAMRPVDAVDFLFDLCDRLLVDEGNIPFSGFRQMGFSPAEARILSELDRCRGHLVPLRVLEAVSNPSRDFDAEGSKVLKVYICKIRAKLTTMDCPVEITTNWGDGYRMAVPQNYRWPWEFGK